MNQSVVRSQSRPLVSIIINCYNGERYLPQALESVRSQSYSNWEIIFWDNASIDGSAALALAFGQPLRYFKNAVNVPLGAARNQALAEAQGAYVVFLDCDDILLPLALEAQVNVLEEYPYALVYGGLIYIDEGGHEIGRKTPDSHRGCLLAEQLYQYDIGLPTVMIRRQVLLDNNLGFEPTFRVAEDYWLFMQLAAAYEICSIPKILAKYRIHQSALTVRSAECWGAEIEYTLKLILEKFPDQKLKHPAAFRAAYARVAYYRARHHVMCGRRYAAMRELAGSLLIDFRYSILFILLFLPLRTWDALHKWRSGRSFRT